MDRVAVFVDVQNVYYTVKQSHGCHFDYKVFWDQVTAGCLSQNRSISFVREDVPQRVGQTVAIFALGKAAFLARGKPLRNGSRVSALPDAKTSAAKVQSKLMR